MDVLNFNDFLNEKKVVIKRKYTESYPAKKLSTYAKVRNQVFSALKNSMLSEEEFSNLLTTANAHNRWFKRNSRFFVVKEENGIKKIGLSSYGQKVMTKTLNESNKSLNEVEMILSKDQDFEDVKRLLRTDKKANILNFTHWSSGQPLGSNRGHLITMFFSNTKEEVANFIQRNDIKIANKSYFDLHESLDYLTEGVWANIMKGVRPSQSPWSIVAIEYNKVVGQSNDIKIPDLVPAKYEALKREYPKARIHIEDGGGQVVWTEKR